MIASGSEVYQKMMCVAKIIRWRWTSAGGGARVSVLAGRKPGTAALARTAYRVRGCGARCILPRNMLSIRFI